MIDLTFNMDNGDCELIHDTENMIGACTRRLNTELDTTLYLEYGSTLINQTVYGCLMQDDRILDCDVSSEYTKDGFKTKIYILCEDNELTFDYEYNGEGGEEYNA